MVMIGATGVKTCTARRTLRAAFKIFLDRKLFATRSAEYRLLSELAQRPDQRIMIGHRVMTFIAWKPFAAAFKFYRDDVGRRMIMKAAGLAINIDADHDFSVDRFSSLFQSSWVYHRL